MTFTLHSNRAKGWGAGGGVKGEGRGVTYLLEAARRLSVVPSGERMLPPLEVPPRLHVVNLWHHEHDKTQR